MAAKTIGSYTFVGWSGSPIIPAGIINKSVQAMGVSGTEEMRVGFTGRPFTITTTSAYNNMIDVEAAVNNFMALQGTVVTVIDNFNVSTANIIIDGCWPISLRIMSAGSGVYSGKTHELTFEWEMRHRQ